MQQVKIFIESFKKTQDTNSTHIHCDDLENSVNNFLKKNSKNIIKTTHSISKNKVCVMIIYKS